MPLHYHIPAARRNTMSDTREQRGVKRARQACRNCRSVLPIASAYRNAELVADCICSTDGKRHVAQASDLVAATVYACAKIANMTMMSLQPLQYPHTSMIQLMW
jgi:hypothetical protein